MAATASARNGRVAVTEKWKPEKLWDIHTPQNTYEAAVSLVEDGGKALDAAHPVRFGFREFWIDGRDFYLNGTRIFLSAVPLDNAQVSAAAASYEGAKESLLRLKSIGINFVYTHNYGCEPGTHLSFEEILRAADDVGMLVSLSQPHFAQYDWNMPAAEENNGYAQPCRVLRPRGRQPSVGGLLFHEPQRHRLRRGHEPGHDRRHPQRPQPVVRQQRQACPAGRSDRRAARSGPHRLSSLLGQPGLDAHEQLLHQHGPGPGTRRLVRTLGHQGVKPLFTCEYMVPCTWDWTMYRGWYKGVRKFGSAAVPWEFCVAEWSSQFLGDRAYRISEAEKKNLRWEAEQFRARQALASLGLSLPGRLAGVRRTSTRSSACT